MVFELIDLQDLGENVLREFKDAVLSGSPDEGFAIGQAAQRLLAKVELAYGVAAKLAEREPTLEGTEAIWAKMVAICDQIARQIQAMEQRDLVSKPCYDRLLDYRNAAESRRQLHS
jgi:hypothetical protein